MGSRRRLFAVDRAGIVAIDLETSTARRIEFADARALGVHAGQLWLVLHDDGHAPRRIDLDAGARREVYIGGVVLGEGSATAAFIVGPAGQGWFSIEAGELRCVRLHRIELGDSLAVETYLSFTHGIRSPLGAIGAALPEPEPLP